MYNRKVHSLLAVLALFSAGFLGLLAIPSGNLVEPAEADSTRAFAGGDGTTSDPYQISNVAQLQNMSADLTSHYILMNDINASATINWNEGKGFNPVSDNSDNSNRFSGSLEGQKYNITDLFLDRPSEDYVGLFGYLTSEAILSNISLIENDMNGNDRVGGLVGWNYGMVSNCSATGDVSGKDEIGGLVGSNRDGTVSNCYSTGSVSGYNEVGGLFGSNNGMVFNCYATGNISGYNEAGGFVGQNRGTVSNCYSTGNVSGNDRIGGFVGLHFGILYNRIVSNCFATGNVSGNEKVGGLVGENYDTVSNCSASGNVSGDVEVGGLVGYDAGSVSNCYATGDVSGTDSDIGGLVGYNNDGPVLNCYATGDVSGIGGRIGGLVGENDGSVSNCYATGNVSGNTEVGGLVGYDSDTVTNCFWDTETSGQSTSDGGTGKITSEMKQEVTFTGASWDFVNTWSIWDGKTYPYLNNITYPEPTITTIDLTTISEDQTYLVSYSAESSLPGCTDFIWELDTDATWLTMDTDGVLGGTPRNDDVGTHSVNIICNDPRLISTTRIFTLSVQNINDAPVINLTLPTNATEDSIYSMPLSAIDIDPTGDTLKWTLESGPAWLEHNTTTNTLEGTPRNSDVGINDVNVSIDDGNGGSDWQRFTIIVENTNDDPIIITSPKNTTLEDEPYSVTFNATDEDPVATNFTWSMDTNADWLELDGNYLNGTPDNSDVGAFWVNITVLDGEGGSYSLNYTLVVDNINDAPIWNLIPTDQNITEGESLFLDCVATDMDGDNITYSIETTPASNLTIDPSSGAISWTSPVVGTYNATITATDGTIEIRHTFSLIVNALPDGPGPDDNQTDTDGDGMPDWWEESYGLDPNDPADAALDSDGDGISNLDEYKQGSDPLVDESVDGSTDTDDKRSYAGFCLIAGIILLLIIVVIVVIVIKSRKSQTDSMEE